jgi:predicted RNA-binding protein with PIN domain
MHWIVDAMNVIGSRPDGWWRDRHAAMVRLVDRLERWASTVNDEVAANDDVTVVFESKPHPRITSSVIVVAHAPRARANSADDEILRLVRAHPNPMAVRVITSDHGLADAVRAEGATVEPSEPFRGRIDPA